LLPDNHPTWEGGKANGIGSTALVIGGNFIFSGSVQNLVPSLAVPHEMGHCLGLYHTFQAGPYTCDELVTRGTDNNCNVCGDLVCDTPAESYKYIWGENANCVYTVNYQDSNGATYNPILSNIMNYVRFNCWRGFTSGQAYRMRNMIALYPVLAKVVASTAIYTGGVYSYGASTYGISSASTTITLNSTANTANLTIPNYGSGTVYNWSVVSKKDGNYTSDFTYLENNATVSVYGGSSFNIKCDVSGTCGSITYNFSFYNYSSSYSMVASPNSANKSLTISAKLVDSKSSATYSSTSTDGQILTTDDINSTQITLLDKNNKVVSTGKLMNETITFNTENIPNGTYYLHISEGKNLITKQIIVQH